MTVFAKVQLTFVRYCFNNFNLYRMYPIPKLYHCLKKLDEIIVLKN